MKQVRNRRFETLVMNKTSVLPAFGISELLGTSLAGAKMPLNVQFQTQLKLSMHSFALLSTMQVGSHIRYIKLRPLSWPL